VLRWRARHRDVDRAAVEARVRWQTTSTGGRATHQSHPLRVVEREREAARVVVDKLGFTQGPSSGAASYVSYGLQLVNRSYEWDGRGIGVALRLTGHHGRALADVSLRLTGVPASSTFYLGGRARVVSADKVERFVVTVTTRRSRKLHLFLPVAAAVQVARDPSGRLRLTGRLTNAYTQKIGEASSIHAVVFDGTGRIIGGGVETVSSATGGEVAPGETAGFEMDVPPPLPSARALFAGVSIDP
jgi:hypothetical protein